LNFQFCPLSFFFASDPFVLLAQTFANAGCISRPAFVSPFFQWKQVRVLGLVPVEENLLVGANESGVSLKHFLHFFTQKIRPPGL